MKRETQKKGDLAKSYAISTFTKMGYEVGILITESASYDLMVDTGLELKRVQVKYCSNGYVDLRHIHSNAQGYVVKNPSENEYDWLYIYTPKNKEYLVKEQILKQGIQLVDKYLIKL